MLLQENRIKLDERIDKETDYEQWRNANSIIAAIKMAEGYDFIVENSKITGIMYSKLFTDWEKEEGSDKVAVSFKEDSIISQELHSFLRNYLTIIIPYSEEKIEEYIQNFGGIIIYE